MPEDLETRTVLTPRVGTKICILIGLAFIIAAIYFFFVPVTSVRTTSGSVFGCGSAAHPAASTFARNTCGGATDVEKYRAFAAGAIGIATIIIGAVMFGVDRRTEVGRTRHPVSSYDDERRDDRYAREDRDRDAARREDRDRDDAGGNRETGRSDTRARDADARTGRSNRDERDQPSDRRDDERDDDHDAPRRARRRREWDDDRA